MRKPPLPARGGWSRRSWLADAAGWACYLGVLVWQVNPPLMHHGGGVIQFFPTFQWGGDFCRELLRQPGGAARYVSALLAQGFQQAWLGALVLAVQAWLLAAGTEAYLRVLDAVRWRWLRWVPPLALLALHASYTCCLLPANALLAALGMALLYAHAGNIVARKRRGFQQPPAWSALVILVLGGLLYAVAGSALTVFVALAAAVELHRGRWKLACLLAPLAVAVPLAADRMSFGPGVDGIWGTIGSVPGNLDGLPSQAKVLLYGLYLLLPVAGVAIVLRRRLKPPGQTVSGRTAAPAGGGGWPGMVRLAAVLGAMGAVVAGFSDQRLKALLEVDYHASRRQWPDVLAAARNNADHSYVRCAVNRAWYHLGRLGHELPLTQTPEHLLLPLGDPAAHWHGIDLYLDLGSLNLALHHATEAIAFYGEQPFLLRRLVLIHLALENIGTARIHLRALRRTPFQAAWAADCLRRLERDPAWVRDEEAARWRQQNPVADDLLPMPAEPLLLRLLEASPDNRMAAEYLIAHRMLARDLQGLARHFRRLDTMGLTNLPPRYDEAAVLAAERAGIDPGQFRPPPSAAALARYRMFQTAALAAGWHPQAPLDLLPKRFAHTYYYYFFSLR